MSDLIGNKAEPGVTAYRVIIQPEYTDQSIQKGKKMSKVAVVFWSGTGNTQAMGAEVLEEAEYEPMFASVEGNLTGKKIALFGSYGWGDGQWMRDWEARCNAAGALLAVESVICNDAPDDQALDDCKGLGAALA